MYLHIIMYRCIYIVKHFTIHYKYTRFTKHLSIGVFRNKKNERENMKYFLFCLNEINLKIFVEHHNKFSYISLFLKNNLTPDHQLQM